MTTKPMHNRSLTSPLPAHEQALALAFVSRPATPPKTAQQAARARTHTWPLPKYEVARVLTPAVPSPSACTSPSKNVTTVTEFPQPPNLSMQEILAQLDRDMANCPYYEVHEIVDWR